MSANWPGITSGLPLFRPEAKPLNSKPILQPGLTVGNPQLSRKFRHQRLQGCFGFLKPMVVFR